jgi:prepilin-type N-terminal cleavage/methylation domain-containing protein
MGTDMITRERKSRARFQGFSLIELMFVVAIITLVLGAILSQLEQVQQRATAEQGKVDDFQQARDFLDQIFRDTRQMGYPNVHNFDISIGAWQSPLVKDHQLAVGLVKLTATQLEFQGDVDGSGNVSVVSYMVNGNGNCTTCIQRAQVLKVDGDPVNGQSNLTATSYSVEVQNVQNTTTIFTAYDSSGTAITLPIDIDTNPTVIPTVRVIQAQLKIASPSALDPKTGQQLEADIEGRIQVVNCSMASTGMISTTGIHLTCQ